MFNLVKSQVEYEPSFKVAPHWTAVLEAVATGAAESDSATGSTSPSGSRSDPVNIADSTFLPTDHHLGEGPHSSDKLDSTISAAREAATAASKAATAASKAAQHQRALRGLRMQKAIRGEAFQWFHHLHEACTEKSCFLLDMNT